MKNALVLSGGSIRGAFQAGAIAEVLESGFVPNAIYGTSVGALNGGILAERAGRTVVGGEKPDWPAIGRELEEFWMKSVTSFNTIGRKRNIFELVIGILFKRFDGLIDTTPLKNIVRELILTENLHASPVQFSACAVSVTSGEAVYATEKDPKIWDYIIASTAIPITMPITWIKDEPFVDGGIREVAPLKRACNEGAENIVSIVCQPEKEKSMSFNPGDLFVLSERLMDIVTNELVNNDLKRFHSVNEVVLEHKSLLDGPLAGKRHIPIVHIRPESTIELNLETFTSAEIEKVLMMGRKAAKLRIEVTSPEWK